jgi:hypothetical protein
MAGFEDDKVEPESVSARKEQAASGLTHARVIPTVEERIAHIVGMMERFEWVRGKSSPALAELWGLSVKTVEGNASEASRRIVGDKDETARDITIGARRLFIDAVNSGDAKGAKAIGDLWADISGAKAPTRQEIGAVIADATEATPAKAREIMNGLFSSQAAPDKQAAADESDERSGENQ